jgi:hypothetical protein
MRGATSKDFPRLHYDPDQRDRQTVAELETGEGNARIGLGPGSRKYSCDRHIAIPNPKMLIGNASKTESRE